MSSDFITQLEHKLMNPEPDLSHLSAEEQNDRILGKVATWPDSVITRDELLDRLRESKATGKPLKIKLGIDPTGPDIHLGHLVPIRNLRLFQRMGHKILLIFGDFTGKIGDPSGRNDERPALTEEQIMRNMSKYDEQASKVLDIDADSVEQFRNGSWLDRVSTREWVNILRDIQVNEILQRKDFRTRLDQGHGLSMAEFLYPIFMGYDSVHLKPDIEIGGIDQYLNMQIGRQMMTNAGIKPQMVISYNLLPGIHGVQDEEGRYIKMGKSLGNHIPVLTEPNDVYAQAMSIPDITMWIWFRELTEITTEELNQLKSYVDDETVDPKTAKELLARVIVGMLNDWDEGIINTAVKDFNFKHPSKDKTNRDRIPDSTETVKIEADEDLIDALQRHTGRRRRELRDLADKGSIKVLEGDQYQSLTQEDIFKKATDWIGSVIRIGKRYYYRLES